MKERPIIFSTDMVKAILEGRKTQTRRVIKPQPPKGFRMRMGINIGVCEEDTNKLPRKQDYVKIPYGAVGDRLWVRETLATANRYNHLKPSEIPQRESILHYLADGYSPFEMGKVRSSLFLPRWASRITLEITGVRVERLQDIGGEGGFGDLKQLRAEGLELGVGAVRGNSHLPWRYDSIVAFQDLWDSINAKRGYGWDTNPWVWVIEFKRSK